MAPSENQRLKLVRFTRTRKAANRSIAAWLKTKQTLSRDEQVAILEVLEINFGLKVLSIRQTIRQRLGQPLEIEAVLIQAESAMIRAGAIKEQLCGRPGNSTKPSQPI